MNHELRRYLTPPKAPKLFRLNIPQLAMVAVLGCFFLPWSMYTSGAGRVTAVDPNERLQEINAPVAGLVQRWHVQEGSHVEKGAPIVDLVDTDPALMGRVEREKQVALDAVASSELALKTAEINLQRQKHLLEDGLSARKEFEKAKIEVSKLAVELSKAQATLVKAETQLSRQNRQSVVAPRDGTVLRILRGAGNQVIKSGDPLLIFAPEVSHPAVELWVSGDDMRFTQRNQSVRIQFEGWPAVQVPGWPSVAIGTFPGKVLLVDHATVSNGKFRILVEPEEHGWPSTNFLRLNANARGYIYLGQTFVAKELWRKLNNFPPSQSIFKEELAHLTAPPPSQTATAKVSPDSAAGGEGEGK